MGYPTLKRGSSGESVKRLQELLNQNGITEEPLVEDGKFGAKTENAVKQFQAEHGLETDGICGPATWEKLTQKESQEQKPDTNTNDANNITVRRAELEYWAESLEEMAKEIKNRLSRG